MPVDDPPKTIKRSFRPFRPNQSGNINIPCRFNTFNRFFLPIMEEYLIKITILGNFRPNNQFYPSNRSFQNTMFRNRWNLRNNFYRSNLQINYEEPIEQ